MGPRERAMPGYLRANVGAMSAYVPGEQPAPGAKVVKLNTNENPYPPSPGVARAVAEALGRDGSLRLYPDPRATALRAKAAALYGVEPDRVLAGNGSDEILALLVRAVVPEGGVIACPVPTYALYRTLAAMSGARAVEVPWAEGYGLPPGLASSGARLVFLARPNSPTSTSVPVDDVRALALELDRRSGGVLCVDEAYADFAGDDCLALARELPNVVVARTLSKSHSLAGARVGFAVGPPGIVAGLDRVRDSYNVSRMNQAAGVAALSDPDWTRANVEKVRRTRARLVGGLRRLGLDCPEPHANFVFAKIGEPRAAELLAALRARGILVRHFDEDGARDALRISVGTDAETDALLAALGEIPGRQRS